MSFSLDIIVCTYNNAALLRRTLEALSRQVVTSSIEWNVFVVNNNSTDDTTRVVENFPNVRLLTERKQGLTAARVCGVANSSSDWVAFVDDDCLLEENWIEQAERFASEHPECGAFGSKIILDWECSPPAFVLNRRYAYAGKQFGDAAHKRSWLPGAGLIVRRKSLNQSGWIQRQLLEDRIGKRLVSGGDMEMSMRIGSVSELWYNPACKLRHIIPATRMTKAYVRGMVFGLGASRHNVDALNWSGSYTTWFVYSLVYGIGFTVSALVQWLRERGDAVICMNPAAGWWLAVWTMLRMDSERRAAILGGVKRVATDRDLVSGLSLSRS